MAWICPTCEKTFRNENQWHSCARRDVDAHFASKPAHIRALYDQLIEEVLTFGEIEVNSVKTSIQLKAGATFASLRPKSDHIFLEFQLGREVTAHPITEAIRLSKNRVLHRAVIEEPNDLEGGMKEWLRESYELVR